MEEQITKIKEFFDENGIAIFWQLQCDNCKIHSSSLAEIKYDMSYNKQQIFNVGLKNGFNCERCGKPYKICGISMWTNHSCFRTQIIDKNDKKMINNE